MRSKDQSRQLPSGKRVPPGKKHRPLKRGWQNLDRSMRARLILIRVPLGHRVVRLVRPAGPISADLILAEVMLGDLTRADLNNAEQN
jgi:hypothetical protein